MREDPLGDEDDDHPPYSEGWGVLAASRPETQPTRDDAVGRALLSVALANASVAEGELAEAVPHPDLWAFSESGGLQLSLAHDGAHACAGPETPRLNHRLAQEARRASG